MNHTNLELIEPAVKGTTGILESALKHAYVSEWRLLKINPNDDNSHSGPQLKRVVVLSSCASVANPTDSGILDENNWNEENIVEIREKGRNAAQTAKYRASKSLAEKGMFYTSSGEQG